MGSHTREGEGARSMAVCGRTLADGGRSFDTCRVGQNEATMGLFIRLSWRRYWSRGSSVSQDLSRLARHAADTVCEAWKRLTSPPPCALEPWEAHLE